MFKRIGVFTFAAATLIGSTSLGIAQSTSGASSPNRTCVDQPSSTGTVGSAGSGSANVASGPSAGMSGSGSGSSSAMTGSTAGTGSMDQRGTTMGGGGAGTGGGAGGLASGRPC